MIVPINTESGRDAMKIPVISLLVLILVWMPFLHAAQSLPPEAKPRLILILVVDQMRADYLERFQDLFGDGGFRLLTQSGASFTHCNYAHVPTNTGPGHSVILSGIMPGRSGIISNSWYSVARGEYVNCVGDPSVRGVGTDSTDSAGKRSPRNFHGTTIGDELLRSSPASKVIGIAIKDRAAILLAGTHPTGAYWFDSRTGRWITSTYYRNELPGWLKTLNASRSVDRFLGRSWTKLLPPAAYKRAGPDSARGEGVLSGEDRPVFPHHVEDLRTVPGGGYDTILPTPFGNDLTIACAESAITGEQLGQRRVTDILAVSFSSPDYCGHRFGPDSHEVEDMYLRLDRQLASFFAFVDSTVGMSDVIVVLTADHGVAPLPEHDPSGTSLRIDPKEVQSYVRVRIGQEFNYNEGEENVIASFSDDFFYIDSVKLERMGISRRRFEELIGKLALHEAKGARYYIRSTLETGDTADGNTDPYLEKLRNGFNPARSGDVVLVPAFGSFFSGGMSGTSHGTGYTYDTHVPLLIRGRGIRPGTYGQACTPNDIAPTLAEVLHIRAPEGCAGSSLRRDGLLVDGRAEGD
jgi:predicted AlkP superfamily pyrophosphatase or phosphodiesterase